jgi:uncharacterized double-CXXCG motif protein
VYEIKCDRNRWRKHMRYSIYMGHRWKLPGLECPVCKESWGGAGLDYPSIMLSGIEEEEAYMGSWPVPLERHRKLTERVKHLLPKGCHASPGTGFGPLSNIVKGRFRPDTDFAWVGSWTLLVSDDAHAKLVDCGIRMPKGVRPEFKKAPKSCPPLRELELLPLVELDESSFKGRRKPCSGCGADFGSLKSKIRPAKRSFPRGVDICRGKNAGTVILCSERFAKAIEDLGLNSIAAEELS